MKQESENLPVECARSIRPIRGLHRVTVIAMYFVTTVALGCGGAVNSGESDDSFAALQSRGQEAMGVDQYTSTHLFDALSDGGRIELQRDVDDPIGIRQIREHLQGIAGAFASGDFSTPAFVHLREVPGTSVMAARRDRIRYLYSELPRGGEVRIVTDDPEAIQAIHEFMAFQREDHRAGGLQAAGANDHNAMDHGSMNHGSMDHGSMDHGSMDHGSMDHGVRAGVMDLDSVAHEERHRTEMASIADPELAADLDLVHQLMVGHASIRRQVTNLPDGIRTRTESNDPRIAAYLIEHVERMDQRLANGDVFNLVSPTLPRIFENAALIRTTIERTPTGVILIQTSSDPETVAALQAHAAEVDDLVREGMAAMMRASGAGESSPNAPDGH